MATMAAILAAEARLSALKGQISQLEAGKPLSAKAVLADLKALRVTVATETTRAMAAGSARDELAAQVEAMAACNTKLRYQNEQLQKAGNGKAAAPPAGFTGAATAPKSKAQKVANLAAPHLDSPGTKKKREDIMAKVAAAKAVAGPAPAPAPGGAVQVEGPSGVSYPCTNKLYFDDMQRTSCEGIVLGVGEVEEKGLVKTVVILDQVRNCQKRSIAAFNFWNFPETLLAWQTVMHPQGGGQPTDFGELR